MLKRSNFTLFLLPLLLSIPLLCCAQDRSSEDTLILQLKWFHAFQFAGYYAAAEKGFYKEEGLDVEILQRDVNTTPVDDVLAGRAHFGISDSSLALRRLNKDPVIALAAIFQSSPLVLMTLADSNLASPLDLAGKRVMYERKDDDAVITAMFNEMGMTEEDFTYIKQTFVHTSLLNGTTDAMSAYISNEPWYYTSRGHKINIINPASYGIDFYGDTLFTSEAMINHSPEKVLAFRRASLRGWKYALNNLSEVYSWLNNKYTGKKYESYEHFFFEANSIIHIIKPKMIEMGNINPSRFRRIADIYRQKQLAPAGSNLRGFIYNDHINNEIIRDWKSFLILLSLILFIIIFVLLTFILKLSNTVRSHKANMLDANRAKGIFLANMSHDLRTPLNSIIGFTERLLNSKAENFNHKTIDALTAISRNSQNLFILINDLLDLSRVDSGHMELSISTCNLQEVIERCYTEVLPQAQEKDLDIYLPKDYAVLYLEADHSRLSQIISNILSNAIKYTARGNISISVDTERTNDQEFCSISVTDTGMGVRLEDQKRLLKRFEQPDDNWVGNYNTSLGLSLITEFARIHGGHISFESTYGVGSTFSLHLPILNSSIK